MDGVLGRFVEDRPPNVGEGDEHQGFPEKCHLLTGDVENHDREPLEDELPFCSADMKAGVLFDGPRGLTYGTLSEVSKREGVVAIYRETRVPVQECRVRCRTRSQGRRPPVLRCVGGLAPPEQPLGNGLDRAMGTTS